MRQVNVLPNIITAFGLSCGLYVIYKVNMTTIEGSSFQLLLSSAVLLLIAAIADVLDGAIARVVKGESDFGVMFDSLADTVSFGVAPSVLLLKSLNLEQGSGLAFFSIACGMLYSICGILRLVRFNVKAYEIKGDEFAMRAHKKNFTGLPIPAGAACAVSLNLFLNSPTFSNWFTMSPLIKTLIITIGTLFVGFFMVSKVKFPSLKGLKVNPSSFYLVFGTAIAAIFILYGIMHHFSLVLFLVSWGYLFLGCLLTLIKVIVGKKSKTLQDYDPDDDLD